MGHSAKIEDSYKIQYIFCHKFRLSQAINNNFITVNLIDKLLISSWSHKFKEHSFLCDEIKYIVAYDNFLTIKNI
jgi:hypothetical protein